jgi:N-acetylneuraminic acid mutarotase
MNESQKQSFFTGAASSTSGRSTPNFLPSASVVIALISLALSANATILTSNGFNSASAPAGWATELVVNTGGSPQISFVTSSSAPTASPYEGSYFVKFNSYSCSSGSQVRLKQTTSFSTAAYNPVGITFAWFQDNSYSAYTSEGVTVQWSTNGTTWNNGTFYQRYNSVNGWRQMQYSLPTAALGQSSVYIAFLFKSQYGNNCYLDYMRVDGTPLPPPPPSALAATNVTVNSFFANWSAVAGITNYLLDLSSTSNFSTFLTGYTNKSVGNVTSWQVTGLNAAATYYYRVRSQAPAGSSTNSSTASVHTSGALSVTNGLAAGGNTLTISGTGLGNGSDVTNVTVCGIAALIQSQTADSVGVVVGAGEGGPGDVRVYSTTSGVTTFVNGYTYKPQGYIFGPFMGWSSVRNLPDVRGQLAAASVNGKIYAIGGYDSNYVSQSTVYVYDPSQPTQGWLSISNLPGAKGQFAAASVNGKVYAIGGYDGGIVAQSTVYVYDPSQPTQGWLSVSNLPAARVSLAAAGVNGKLYAIGGEGSGGIQSTVYVYDPSQPTRGWLSVSNLPAPREYLAATSVNGKIYVLGGYSTNSYQSAVYVYDPLQPAQGWSSLSRSLPMATYGLAAASENGKVYAIGGYANGDFQSAVYEYDPSQPAQGWQSVGNLPDLRGWLATLSVNGKIYALGGFDGSSNQSTVFEGTFASGVVPPSGTLAGGNTVILSGNYLGESDVTNVSLCGFNAAILADHSPTQIVVSAATALIPAIGDVVVSSATCGTFVRSNGYAYLPVAPAALAASNITANSFSANWTIVANTTNYCLDISTAIQERINNAT